MTILRRSPPPCILPLHAGESRVVQRILPPGAESGKHTQSGNEIVYIQEGSVIFEAQGKPAVTLKPGEALINLSNARSSPWVGRRPMANSLSLATGVLSLIASVDKQVRHGWKIATLPSGISAASRTSETRSDSRRANDKRPCTSPLRCRTLGELPA